MAKRLFKNLIVSIGTFILFLYLSFLFIVPLFISSTFFENKVEQFLYSKKGILLNIENIKFKSYWNLAFDFSASKIVVNDKSKNDVIVVDNIFAKVNSFKLDYLNVDYAFIDALRIKDLLAKKEASDSSGFSLKYIPLVNIKKVLISAYNSDESNFNFDGNNIVIYQQENDIICSLNIIINSSFLNNTIVVGDDGYLVYNNSELFAKGLSLKFGESKLYLEGKVFDSEKKSDFKISGKSLPIHDIQSSLLYFQKLKKKGKVFIENFYDFAGTVDVDLVYKDGSLNGICETKKLSAKSVLFNVPIFFEKALFNFKDKAIWSEAYGKIGTEKVYNYFVLTGMGTDNQEVKGHVKSVLSNDFVAEYIPDLRIVGSADTSVNYNVKNGEIGVSYLVKLNSGSDLHYKTANLGLFAYDRRLFVKTLKEGDKLAITHYDYSLRDGNEITNILLGNGLFLKENGKFTLQYLNGKTNGYAPVSVTGSFGEYVDGGLFDGDLHYDNKKKIITGDFTIVDSNYKDVYLEKAVISADTQNMNITAVGTYDDSPYSCEISAKNDFNNEIKIYNMDLFLDEFIIRKGDYKVRTKRMTTSEKKKNDINISIDNWKIQLNKISHKRIVLENILLSGSLKNDIFNFLMSNVSFAKGLLNAQGWYNFNNHSSCIDFSADKIDSNVFADAVLGLTNQISGLASAKLHADTKNKLKDINAIISFSVDEGYLPTLGSTEFLIKKSSKIKRPLKIKLSDIINIDITKSKAMASDLKGSFEVDNYDMKDIKLTSQQKYLSMLIEGDYDIKAQDADLKLWGKYNKTAQRGVKILFVPLSWILKVVFKPEHTKQLYQNKIDEVPDIVSKPEDEQAFRVKLEGNINTNNVHVELKSII